MDPRRWAPSPNARLLLECAALLGYRFEAGILAACCALDPIGAAAILTEACLCGLLVCESARERRYRFRHALYRSAIREALEPAHSRALHARIAATLECQRESPAGAETLAYHWGCAGDERRARLYRKRAASEARRLGSSG